MLKSRHTRLDAILDRYADRAAILLTAPTGFGKSELLAHWRRLLITSGRSVVWLPIEPGWNARTFTEKLMALLPDMPASPPVPPAETARFLCASLAARDRAITLLLDDVELLDPDALTVLNDLLSSLRPGAQLICSARCNMLDIWHGLAAKGMLGIVNRQTLAFTRPETTATLIAAASESGASKHITSLATLTDDVPQLVQYAREALADGTTDPVAVFIARTRDWLNEHVPVLSQEPATSLLQSISILNETSIEPELAGVVAERADSMKILSDLATNTPLIRIERDGNLQLHPLVAVLFPCHSIQAKEQGYQRAGHWLASRRPVSAIGYLLKVHEVDRACELIEAELMDAVATGRVATALDWIEHIPESTLRARSGLRLTICWALAIGGRDSEMRALLNADPQTASESLKAVIEGLVACGADDPDLAATKVAEAGENVQSDPAFEAVRKNIIRWVDQQRGLGRVRVATTLPHADARRDPRQFYSFSMTLFRDAEISLDTGRALEAVEMLVPVERRARQELGANSAVTTILTSALAAAYRQAGDNLRAAAALGTDQISEASWTNPSALWLTLVTRARLARDMGDMSQAFELIDRIEAIADARNLYRIRALALAEGIRLGVACGSEAQIQPRVAKLRELLSNAGKLGAIRSLLVQLHCNVGLVSALIANEAWLEAKSVHSEAMDTALKLGRTYDQADLLLLEAKIPGFIPADGASLLHPQDWATLQRDHNIGAALAKLHSTPPRTNQKAILMTSKEREILELLAAGVPNKQIAQALLISVETVKWHLKNIYNKLEVHDRANVVQRARELALVD